MVRVDVRIRNKAEGFGHAYDKPATHEHEVQDLKQRVGLPTNVVPELLQTLDSPLPEDCAEDCVQQEVRQPLQQQHSKRVLTRQDEQCEQEEAQHDEKNACRAHLEDDLTHSHTPARPGES